MKNLDLLSRRLLAFAIAISMVLISCAIFLFSLNYVGKAQASGMNSVEYNYTALKQAQLVQDTVANNDEITNMDIFAVHAFGMGIRDGNLYFGILYNNNTIGLHVAPAEGEDVIPW